MIGIQGTVPLNGGRGRATLQCAWSIHRIDQQLGRLLDINSAWRDPQEQERFYQAYIRDPKNNPIALPPEKSVHCEGEAIDTDDNNAAMTRILNNNGWFHTVFRWVNGVYTLVEPWHYEYDYKRDKFFGGIPAGSAEQETDLTPDESARLNRVEATLNNVEQILARMQNAINDPSNGIFVNAAAAEGNSSNAANISSEVRNLIKDPNVGILQSLRKLESNTAPKA